jgi:hypothetical protein
MRFRMPRHPLCARIRRGFYRRTPLSLRRAALRLPALWRW